MYHKPKVERFGTVRELTLVGWVGSFDGFTILGPPDGTGNDCSTGATSPCLPPTSS